MSTPAHTLPNFIGGEWRASSAAETLGFLNPATAETLGRVPISPASEVDEAARAAAAACREWCRVPAMKDTAPTAAVRCTVDGRQDAKQEILV